MSEIIKNLHKLIPALRHEGIARVATRIKRHYIYKFFNKFAGWRSAVNSRRYWDIRMKFNWDQVGGDIQTRQFAVGLLVAVDLKELLGVSSILDYGCATGESLPVLRTVFPDSKLYVYDFSIHGMKIAIQKYQKTLGAELWDKKSKVDLVYCSNVIEHVQEPSEFISGLISSAKKYVIVQCPYNELGENDRKITPENPQGEHIWTVDDDFIMRNFQNEKVTWKKYTCKVPLAWDSGEQLFLVGTINS
jgi:2-polyprenyl-3-methyl-5-hydroxy-6-metoxy-1,4-benzoquinol methylase